MSRARPDPLPVEMHHALSSHDVPRIAELLGVAGDTAHVIEKAVREAYSNGRADELLSAEWAAAREATAAGRRIDHAKSILRELADHPRSKKALAAARRYLDGEASS